jgi:hypothetical protein
MHIRNRAYQLQSLGRIDTIQEPDYVRPMKEEFSHLLNQTSGLNRARLLKKRHKPFDMGLPERMNRKMGKQEKEKKTKKRKKEIFMILEMNLLLRKLQDL